MDVKEPIKLDPFQGHIVLFCKHHYRIPEDVSFFEALRRIWAIRCGYDHIHTSDSTDAYIATDMWKIITKCCPERLTTYMDHFHTEIANQSFWKPKGMTPIQAMIHEYERIISNIQVKDRVGLGDTWVDLVELPKPMPEVFNRILCGEGEYSDYRLVVG
jgi:hypothetical protein